MKQSERDFANPSHGTHLLTVSLAQQGYRLSEFCRKLMKTEDREAFKADAEGYMRQCGLTEQEMAMVRARDWLAMVRYGVNHFLVFRAAGVAGVGLTGTGAQMRGETLDEFRQTRRVWEGSLVARIIAGMGSPHAPSVGGAIDRHNEQSPYWKPLFDGYQPMREWLEREKPDVIVLFSNDHFTSFFLDVIPTFALGVAGMHEIADEGWGKRPLPPVPGHTELAWHLAQSLVEENFDPAVCHRMPLDHGCLTPLSALLPWEPNWPCAVIPILVNVLHFPIPTPMRCFQFGQALRRAIHSFEDDLKVVVLGTGGLSHQLTGERFGHINPVWDAEFLDRLEKDPGSLALLKHADFIERGGTESVEVILWLCMRGALSEQVHCVHRNYYHATLTGYGQVIYEDLEQRPRAKDHALPQQKKA